MEAGYSHRAGYTSRTGHPAKEQKASKVPVTFRKTFSFPLVSLLLSEITPLFFHATVY